MLGRRLKDAFAVEAQCLSWYQAKIAFVPHGISPFFAVVTFSVDDLNLIRLFDYQSQSDQWIPTVETSC